VVTRSRTLHLQHLASLHVHRHSVRLELHAMFDEHARDFVMWVEHSCSYGQAACDLESSTQTRKTEQVTFLVLKSSVSMIDGDGEWSMSRGCDATLKLCVIFVGYMIRITT
jgi:hypothetical protein